MKYLNRTIILSLILFFIFATNLLSQNISDGEFMIVNQTGTSTGYSISVKIYPVGAIFNGGNEYTVKAHNPIDPIYNPYIYGKEISISNVQSGTGWYALANFDKSDAIQLCQFSLGYGRYRIDFYEGTTKKNTCDVDFSDANFTGQDVSGYIQHLRIDYYSSTEITFQFINPNSENVNITEVNNYIKVWEQVGTGNSALTPSKGDFTDSQDPASQYHAFPLDATTFGHFAHVTPEEVNLNLNVSHQNADLITDKTLNFRNCIFEISSGYNFTINGGSNQNPQMLITGAGAKFVSGNSKINFPQNFLLKVEDNAELRSNGTKFQPPENQYDWRGISFISPSIIKIDNCEFYYSPSFIHSNNNNGNYFLIANSIFHISDNSSYNYVVTIINTKNFNLYNNEFIYGNPFSFSFGVEIVNITNSEEDNNDAPNTPIINISDNKFHYGTIHLCIQGLTNNVIPIYIYNNNFEIATTVNMRLSYVSGTIEKNIISNNPVSELNNKCIEIDNSTIDLLNNEISSWTDNIFIARKSSVNLSPYKIGNEYFWYAGKNACTSSHHYNINAPDGQQPYGYFFTDNGKNSFSISSNNYHIYGYLDMNCTTDIYYTRCNFWNVNQNPNIQLYGHNLSNTCGVPNENIIWSQENCNFDEQIVDRIINDMGNGLYDTILVTQANFDSTLSEDMILCGIGVNNQKAKNYSYAISNFKNLINTYPNSKNLERAIFNLYECYVLSDTNHNQGWRNVIFGDLKNYLEVKIQQYENNEKFVNLAFDFFIKCTIMKKGYQLAMDGYEFIAENSPSAEDRLMASINYIDVEGLLQGSGGGQKDKYEDELSSDRNGKPIKDILLASYKNTKKSNEKRDKSELQNSLYVAQTKDLQQKKHKQEKVLENRALENISISSGLNKKERRERIQKDLMLLHSRSETSEKIVKKNNIEPLKYELSQNYPNPFNPITNIKYQIQKTGLVTLKIYDITGREIKTLVNEIKNPGNYLFSFNGTEFASGVYFYKIQVGDFVQVKKMVLIK
jgi:hypothetical protein